MHIQEIIIDGFKSYASKTVISGFDSQFNAITGLNGTGKSNILDSICFVLGINNLSQVKCCFCVFFYPFQPFLCFVSSLVVSCLFFRFVLVIYKNLFISKVKQVLQKLLLQLFLIILILLPHQLVMKIINKSL
jgi:hypothetical protein